MSLSKNNRILFLVNDLEFFISHRLEIAINARNNGYSVFVVSDKLPEVNYNDIKFLKINLKRSSLSFFSNFISIRDFYFVVKKISPILVHSITLKSIVISNLALIFDKKIKLINAISGLGYLFTSNRNPIALKLLKFVLKTINSIGKPYYIFQNENDLQEFKKLGVKENYSLIKGSGVNHKDFKYNPPSKKDKISITYTGRILKDKGIIELINAVEILPKEIKSKVVLNIYGKIDLDNPTHIAEKEIKKLLKPNLIIWHGNSDDIKAVLIESDIYCLPSYREGLPKSTLEAMAIGRPIVTTNAPGCGDTVLEGVNGLKVNIKDHIALSKKLQILIEDEALRIEMGKNSRKLFEKEFTLEKVVNQTFEIYNFLLKR